MILFKVALTVLFAPILFIIWVFINIVTWGVGTLGLLYFGYRVDAEMRKEDKIAARKLRKEQENS